MRKDLKAMASSYSTVGLELVLSIIVGFLGGRWLDGKLGTHPWLSLVGFFFGVAAGFRTLWRAGRRMQRETERDGFREEDTDRAARFELEERRKERDPDREGDA